MFILTFLLLFAGAGALANAEETVGDEDENNHSKIKYKFYLQGSSLVNTNHPADNYNDFRLFDSKSNCITLDIAELLIQQNALRESPLGFKLRFIAGEYARYTNSKGLCENSDSQFDLIDANVSWILPGNGKLKLTAGKMGTFVGAEYAEAVENPNYSRSFLFNYAQPTSHTGFSLSYEFGPRFNAAAYYVNGWDNFSDGNNAKTIGLNLNFIPAENLSTSFNFLSGPEQDRNNYDNRFLFDWVGIYSPCKKLSFILNYDYGEEQNILPGGKKAIWSGFSGAAKYDFTEKFSLGFRAEQFNDPQGYRTGVPQTLREFTITPGFKINDNLSVKPEYRYDCSDKKSFNDGKSKNQSTYGIGVMINL